MVDTEILNPATSALIGASAAIERKLDEILAALTRREEPARSIFRLGSVAKQTSLRFRISEIVVSVSAAGTYGLQVGTSVVFQFQVNGPDSKVFPFPVTVDSGKDISISGTAANIVDAYITFVPDEKGDA